MFISKEQSGEIFLSVDALSKRWGVSKSQLAKARHYGKGPNFTKIFDLVRYHIEDVKAYEAAQTQTTTTKRKVA